MHCPIFVLIQTTSDVNIISYKFARSRKTAETSQVQRTISYLNDDQTL